MSTEVPGHSSRPLKVTVRPAPGMVVATTSDSFTAAVEVPIARVSITQLCEEPVPTPTAPAVMGTEALPDDPAVLKQMIAELLRELRRSRRNEDELQHRLDALLRRLYGPRPTPTNPDQPLLFTEPDASPVSLPPPSLPPADHPPSRRGQSRPHGRRRPPAHLRRDPRRYELTEAERRCPECGHDRREIGIETTEQYD